MGGASRRTFLKALSVAIGGLLTAVLAVPGLRFLAFPARRRIVQGPNDFLPVGPERAVTAKPLRVEIVAPAQRDAWAKVQDVRLGAAWLVRDPSGAVRAFTTTCPHLGCAVDLDESAGQFRCPCHTSAFALSGDRISGPAKRGLDPLETLIDEDGRVLVRFRRFKPDVAEREDV
jgi:Rieske Fe-S protein